MKELDPDEWVFVGEYLTHGDASKAYRVATGYDGPYAADGGWKMRKRPHVEAELQRARSEIRAATQLTPQTIVDDIAKVLNADPAELISYVTGSCRHCHGEDHRYHRTRDEMRRAMRAWEADTDPRKPPFDPQGGEGFNAYRDPHPDCPECCGKGVQHARLTDTRLLSPEAAALYDGIEQTRHGIKVKLRSKDAAREAAARILGLNKETVNVTVQKKLEDYTDAELIALMDKGKK